MASHRKELTVDQLLDDPLILAVMRADRVDPARLRVMLARLSASLDPSGQAVSATTPPAARSLAGVCAAITCRNGAGAW
ncbi:MAG: hypothetical protein J0H01_22900 [Rhizobiales bacterium]|nr:hypothetical protein [Hyphomicrobiales bacterium]